MCLVVFIGLIGFQVVESILLPTTDRVCLGITYLCRLLEDDCVLSCVGVPVDASFSTQNALYTYYIYIPQGFI